VTVDPAAGDRRRATRARKVAGKACADCGEIDPTVLDFDHDVGEALDSDAGTTRCANDHRRVTARRRDDGVQLRPAPTTVLEREITAALSLAVSLEANGSGLRRRARRLELFVDRLDAEGVPWREWPEALP
jgi:hypothetical protein